MSLVFAYYAWQHETPGYTDITVCYAQFTGKWKEKR